MNVAPTITGPTCPCCGAPVRERSDLRWNRHERTLVGRGCALALPLQIGTVFDALWQQRAAGIWINSDRLAERLYQARPDGGPLSAAQRVSQHVRKLRALLQPLGITVESTNGPGGGYRLVERSP